MKFHKDPGFQERRGHAAEAKKRALDALRAKPAVDPEVLAQRREAHQVRQSAQAQARADKKAEELAMKQAKIAETAANLKSAEQAASSTEAERKAARDARYAARKGRN
jgi:hypothetical protein